MYLNKWLPKIDIRNKIRVLSEVTALLAAARVVVVNMNKTIRLFEQLFEHPNILNRYKEWLP